MGTSTGARLLSAIIGVIELGNIRNFSPSCLDWGVFPGSLKTHLRYAHRLVLIFIRIWRVLAAHRCVT